MRREITRRGGQKPCLRIVRKLFAALADPAGVIAHRRGALERVQLLLEDWADTQRQARRHRDPDGRACSTSSSSPSWSPRSPGSPRSAPRRSWPRPATRRRFATARALVKHAGLAPREKLSGTFTGRTKLTGQGRPGLRLAAWRAVWGAQHANPVYAARYRHLTTREHNKLTPTQAQTVIAAAILRHLHAVITTGQAWDPAIATHGTRAQARPPRSPPDHAQAAHQADGRGEPYAALRTTEYLDAHHGQPRPSSHQPDYTLPGTNPIHRYAGTDDGRGTDQTLDAKRLTLDERAAQRGRMSTVPWSEQACPSRNVQR